MLESLKKRPGSLRWPPRQKFCVTEHGREALSAYRLTIEEQQALRQGREGLERAQQAWAERFGVGAQDAVVLGELEEKERRPGEIQRSLEDCGITLAQVQEAVDRLFVAGLLSPVGREGPLPEPEPSGVDHF